MLGRKGERAKATGGESAKQQGERERGGTKRCVRRGFGGGRTGGQKAGAKGEEGGLRKREEEGGREEGEKSRER